MNLQQNCIFLISSQWRYHQELGTNPTSKWHRDRNEMKEVFLDQSKYWYRDRMNESRPSYSLLHLTYRQTQTCFLRRPKWQSHVYQLKMVLGFPMSMKKGWLVPTFHYLFLENPMQTQILRQKDQYVNYIHQINTSIKMFR